MATDVSITFSGLCMFTQEEDVGGNEATVVTLVDATKGGNTYCNHPLRPHVGMILATASQLGVVGGYQKIGWPVRGLDLTLGPSNGAAPAPPSDIASVFRLSGCPRRPPTPNRVLARVTLRGGSFSGPPVKAASGVDDGWTATDKVPARLRWQTTWSGAYEGARLVLTTGAGMVALVPDGGQIHLQIVNVMPSDLGEWLKPDNVPFPRHGSAMSAEDFRWFFWMHSLDTGCATPCEDHEIPERQMGAEDAEDLRGGSPYTCVLAGE